MYIYIARCSFTLKHGTAENRARPISLICCNCYESRGGGGGKGSGGGRTVCGKRRVPPMGLVWYTCYVVRETCVKSRVYWVVSNFGIRDSR